MSLYSVAVLISEYSADVFTAQTVGTPEVSTTGTSAAEVFARVRDRLRKLARNGEPIHWSTTPRYDIQFTSVTIRLFYEENGRQYPATREVRFPIRYVLGYEFDESAFCYFPEFSTAFFCPVPSELDRMIQEQIRGRAAMMSSNELTAAAIPSSSEIRIVRVRPRDKKLKTLTEMPPTLAEIAQPMVRRVRGEGHKRTFGRIEESNLICRVLEQGCVLVVGDSGCGKTNTLELAAQLMQARSNATAVERDDDHPISVVWQTSAENLIAGMAYLGQWEERVEMVIAECQAESLTLAVGALIELVRLGGSSPTDSIASFLIPYLRRGELRVVAEASDEELQAVRRLLPGFAECFEIVRVETPSQRSVTELLRYRLREASRNYSLDVDKSAPTLISSLMTRYTPYEAPPRAAIEVTDELITSCTQSSISRIGTQQIVKAVLMRTGVPEVVLRDEIALSIDEVRTALGYHVIGQFKAVDIAAGVVLKLKAGLCDPQRPIATMMFCGPTGVGKTQLARSLADFLFGAGKKIDSAPGEMASPMIRLDMSEYGGYDGVHRLTIGDDGEVAEWIGRLRNHPLSVLLLDEFEKASPEVHDIWLSAMDEGRLTDRFGRTTSLCGTIMILTSNVGAARSSAVGFRGDDPTQAVAGIDRAIRHAFRPEFLNRLDDIVTFDPISPEVARLIVIKELENLRDREAMRHHRIRLQWSDQTVNDLLETGFDPQFGARPLQRAIEQTIVPKIARALLNRPQNSEPLEMSL